MNNDSQLIEKKLKELELRKLTKNEKQTLQTQFIQYQEKHSKIKTQIEELRKSISNLENNLEESIPKVLGAPFVHYGQSGCGLRTVILLEKHKDFPTNYYCLMCDIGFQPDPSFHYTDNDF